LYDADGVVFVIAAAVAVAETFFCIDDKGRVPVFVIGMDASTFDYVVTYGSEPVLALIFSRDIQPRGAI
jgi:hypothetical protein